jgi:hypothetical protein
MMFREQAEQCRRQASEFAGRPEAPFLLSVASAFDELASEADARLITGRERRVMLQSAPPMTA